MRMNRRNRRKGKTAIVLAFSILLSMIMPGSRLCLAEEGTLSPPACELEEPEKEPDHYEEGMLSKPDHPESFTNDKLIFIGDSRTVDIKNAVNDDSIWSCKVGKGYNWMSSTGVPDIEDEIEDNTAVIFLMGVNDPGNLVHYINYINAKANEWQKLGAQTYFVSVGPVTNDPYVTNSQIEVFNDSMEASLVGVIFIDIYHHLVENGYTTTDGTHYPDDVSIEIYNYILDHLEEQTSGIWG
ncbi:MAG: SGNH/GDSL hydrolase family protein [Blautia sp.]|nr:SGNH/GDSL hydrolase family protein [Blautia sp.]